MTPKKNRNNKPVSWCGCFIDLNSHLGGIVFCDIHAKAFVFKEALEKIAHSMDWEGHEPIPCQECGGTEIAKEALK